MKAFFLFGISFLLFCLSQNLLAQPTVQQRIPQKSRILFLLDCSGSMRTAWNGSPRIDIAKRQIMKIIDSMKVNKNVEFGLRVYGHLHDQKLKNCTDSKLEVPFGTNVISEIRKKLLALQAKGITPIAYSLEQATKDFPPDPTNEYRNILIMLTDGVESCKGDPCAISLNLQKKGIFLRPFIIGLGMGQDFGKAFECIGKAYDAKDEQMFEHFLGTVIRQTISKTTISVDLLDLQNKATETNVNMTFLNNITQKSVYDIVHYKNKKGVSDTIEIDPLITYDLIINTIPPVVKENLAFEGGKHNLVTVKTPQGALTVEMRASSEYGNNLQAIVRQNGKPATINHQKIGSTEEYLVGKYDIEVLTTPRTYFENVSIEQSQMKVLSIAQAGLLNLRNLFEGYGSIYVIDEKGQNWACNLNIINKDMTIPLQPNRYKLVFRAKEAKGSVYTIVRYFSIESGQAVSLDILK